MPARRIWIAAALAVVLVAGGASAWLVIRRSTPGPVLPGRAPTIVLILTDDQRWDTLDAMPIVQRELVQHGVTFANSFVVDPICCPSRASTISGRYPYQTGVWDNTGPHGGFKSFKGDASTVATWLHDRGYRTALIGKYLNRYENTTYIPPGWDRWVAFDGSKDRENFYYRYKLNVDGKLENHGNSPKDYSTDVLADRAVSFIRDTSGPLFVYYAPYAPHTPAIPDPPDAKAFQDLKPTRPPSFNEQDVKDKPRWAQAIPPLTPTEVGRIDLLHRHMLASLQAVDRSVGRIVDALAQTGRLDHAMIVFASDNGFSWGEHRLDTKFAPWEENNRVPLVIRYDPVTRKPRTDDHLVQNIDLAPTFADLAGAKSPGAAGRSLLPLLGGRSTGWRTGLLIQGIRNSVSSLGHVTRIPAYCSLRTERYAFTEYDSGEAELYDLRKDPYELVNVAAKPAWKSTVSALRMRLHALCVPAPGAAPGFPP